MHSGIKTAINLLNVGLVVALGGSLATLTWTIAGFFTPAPTPLSAETARADLPKVGAASVAVGASTISPHLFGVLPVPGRLDTPSTVQPARRSTLKIKVLGILAGGSGPRAAILEHGLRQHAYVEGDNLTGLKEEVTLVEVDIDQVIILRDGVREVIPLEKRDLRGSTTGIVSSAPEPSHVDLGTDRLREIVPDVGAVLKEKPHTLLDFVAARPVLTDGELQGYRIGPGRDARLFESLPLRPGDILSEVNGTPVSELSLPSLQALLDQQTEFEITLLRNDVPVTLMVSF